MIVVFSSTNTKLFIVHWKSLIVILSWELSIKLILSFLKQVKTKSLKFVLSFCWFECHLKKAKKRQKQKMPKKCLVILGVSPQQNGSVQNDLNDCALCEYLGVDGAWGWWKASAHPVLCCVERVDPILHPGVDRLSPDSCVLWRSLYCTNISFDLRSFHSRYLCHSILLFQSYVTDSLYENMLYFSSCPSKCLFLQ